MTLTAEFLVFGRKTSVGEGGAFRACFAAVENLAAFARSVRPGRSHQVSLFPMEGQ